MKMIDDIKESIKREYAADLENSIINLIKHYRAGDEKCVYFTVMRNNEINKSVSEEVMRDVKNAGYDVTTDDETGIFVRYKITIEL